MGQWLSKADLGARVRGRDSELEFAGTLVLYEGGRITRVYLHDPDAMQVMLLNPANISMWEVGAVAASPPTSVQAALDGKSCASVNQALLGCDCEVVSAGAEAVGIFKGFAITPLMAVVLSGSQGQRVILPRAQLMVVRFKEADFLQTVGGKLRPGRSGGDMRRRKTSS